MTINYVKGDATKPLGDGHKYIVHICNDLGAWGSGFVLAVSRRWSEPERQYRIWSQVGRGKGFQLGKIQIVKVEGDISVVNMISQHNVGMRNGPPIRYDAVEQGLTSLAYHMRQDSPLVLGAPSGSVHMPRIGCGLAGGKWEEIEPVVQRTLVDKGISVTVYDL